MVDTQYKTEFPDSVVNSRGDVLCKHIISGEIVCIELKLTSLTTSQMIKYTRGEPKKAFIDDAEYVYEDCVTFRNILQLFSSMIPKKSNKGYIFYACSDNNYSLVSLTVESDKLVVQTNGKDFELDINLLYGMLQSTTICIGTKQDCIKDIMAQKYKSMFNKSCGPQVWKRGQIAVH